MAGRFVLLAFDRTADAESFLTRAGVVSDHFGIVAGVFLKPTEFCACAPRRIGGRVKTMVNTFRRAAKWDIPVCPVCRRPPPSWGDFMPRMVMALGRPEDMA